MAISIIEKQILKELRNRPLVGFAQIGTCIFEPEIIWDLLFIERNYLDLRRWFSAVQDRFLERAIQVAYRLAVGRDWFSCHHADVYALRYFVVEFHKIVVKEFCEGRLTTYGWIPRVQLIGIDEWNYRVQCLPYKGLCTTDLPKLKRVTLDGVTFVPKKKLKVLEKKRKCKSCIKRKETETELESKPKKRKPKSKPKRRRSREPRLLRTLIRNTMKT